MDIFTTTDFYKIIVESSNEGIWIIDSKNNTSFVNQRMAQILGYTTEEMIGKSLFNFMDEEGIEITTSNIERRKSGISELHEFKLVAKDQKVVWTYMNTNPIALEGQYQGTLAMVTDISEIKKNDTLNLENFSHYISLFEDSPIPIWDEDFSAIKIAIDELKKKGIRDIRKHLISNPYELAQISQLLVVNNINQAVVTLNEGKSKEEVLDNFKNLITDKSVHYILLQFEAIANGNTSCEFDAELITLKGNRRHVHLKWSVAKGHENTYKRVYLTTTDLTERIKEDNLLLQQSNREKATLLKEVHHRVKNNLQIISSLLKLQSYTIEESEIKAILDVSLGRINSMAKVHELLYQSSDFSKIDYREYLEILINSLIKTMCDEHQTIEVELNVDDVQLTINTAIPLGLLINEILTNSLKHGFESRQNGAIYVKIYRVEKSQYHLEIGDNGIGFEQIATKELKETLGLSLIESLSDQLSGKIIREMGSIGTHYRLTFETLK